MKLKPVKLAPALIAVGVILFVCFLYLLHLDFVDRLEAITYDMRVREALNFNPAVATNLGFVDINEASIAAVRNGSVGFHYGLYWPRQVYARVVNELADQNAKAVAFDVIFSELRHDHPAVYMRNGSNVESDVYFAQAVQRAGNVILAITTNVMPPLFATNASALGGITVEKDSDGVLRRARAFEMVTNWHAAFRQVAADPEFGIDLARAQIEPNKIILVRSNADSITIPLDGNGDFDLADFGGDHLPPGAPRKAKPFERERIWHMGIALAARELQLDLKNADIDLARGRIVLHGPGGVERTIPVDERGYFNINWSFPPNDARLGEEPIQNLLLQAKMRLDGETNGLVNHWAGKLAIVGSSALGNDLTDRGTTPLEKDTLLASEHWNVANSILTNQFVRRSSVTTDLLLIALLGIIAALVTWYLRVLLASGLVLVTAVAYVTVGNLLYIHFHYWVPLVMPVAGALLLTYVCLVAWRVIFEQAEQRRVKSIFSRLVSPNIVNELLGAEKLSLEGTRGEVTVLFADVRGFTEFTDSTQEKAEAYVLEHNLSPTDVETYFNEQARETLSTVNRYLSLVADQVKKHEGTLDKYIGDCVMAFWGAPTPNPQHALGCVRAAIDAQRAVYETNQQRATENRSREVENQARASAGLPPKPLLPTLLIGTGINTGMVTVGLMGSEAHLSNYTVFGREVNLASRLETVSGRGRIVISETTYNCLKRDDPTLAATCVALPDATVKGIRVAVKVYEVPWRTSESSSSSTAAA